tara:strand:+ start:242 stop:469 length:228 start_codon:yes stop_codon:yes gene_type:complete
MCKREEALLMGYKLLYNKEAKLITERTSVDINKLKIYFTDEEFNTLKTVIREATQKLDEVHSYIEASLNARKMTN